MRILIIFAILATTLVAACKKEHTHEPKKMAVVTTIAGTGETGHLNGPALSSKFFGPYDVAVLSDGVIYATDLYRIRKINGDQVTDFAGGATAGAANGNGDAARFSEPGVLTSDASNNAILYDGGNRLLRKITPNADVATYAGLTGASGHTDGPLATATLSDCYGMMVDQHGSLIFSDIQNNLIRKVSSNGQVTTIAGSGVPGFADGNAAASKFNVPVGVAVDKQDNIYVADDENYRIRKISPNGIVSTFAGTGLQGQIDGSKDIAQFYVLMDMVIDKDGNLFVIDYQRIRKISPAGDVSTIAGSTSGFADGDSTNAKFSFPTGLAIDALGNIFVADGGNRRIRKISFVPIQ